MNVYTVVVSWRPNVNKRERTERTLTAEAPNRDQALLFAGAQLERDGESVFKPSVRIDSVTRRRFP